MIVPAALGLILLALPPRTAEVPNVDRGPANQFADVVYTLARHVADEYATPVAVKDLVGAAIRGMYEEAGTPMPDAVRAAILRADNPGDQVKLLADARIALDKSPALAGTKGLFAAANGFRHATDANCQLAARRTSSAASVEVDFGVGIELEGVNAARWALFQAEHGFATGRYPLVGGFRPPAVAALQCPAALPWRVRRVVPGSPAQKAGVRPGDVLTHLNGTEITPESATRLFITMAYPPAAFDPNLGGIAPVKRAFRVRRGSDPKPFQVELTALPYTPETVFGVIREADGKWDCMLDRQYRIGYVRVGPIEGRTEGADDWTDAKLAELLDPLVARGARAVILDLRWCPGGYVAPGTRLAGMFLKKDAVISQTRVRHPARQHALPPISTNPFPDGGKFANLPLLVLVGSETTGGGELIAAALQDAGRCEVMGQRTVGRATIQTPIEAGFGELEFRVSTGYSFRANGKPRQKLPTSGPTDDWGVRPDPGLEVPVTADLMAELRVAAETHALRPADSDVALPFDDPNRDPYRAAALLHLRKKLGRP